MLCPSRYDDNIARLHGLIDPLDGRETFSRGEEEDLIDGVDL
jgi:hypothetical protein